MLPDSQETSRLAAGRSPWWIKEMQNLGLDQDFWSSLRLALMKIIVMKSLISKELINQLQADVRQIITDAVYLKAVDPGVLLQQPAPGKWSVIQIIEHLNSYDRYYFLAIEKALRKNAPATALYRPGWVGEYFTKLMKPGEGGTITNKMQAPKGHRPPPGLDAFPVLNDFIDQQHYLLELLEQARQKDIGSIRVPISISKFIKLKLGDTFRFLVAHKQRHFVQIRNTLMVLKETTGKYQGVLPVN